jgi:phosphate transport system permease protein
MSMQSATQAPVSAEERKARLAREVQRLIITNNIALGVLWIVAAIVALIFVAIIVYLVLRGLPALTSRGIFGTGPAGLGPYIFNTFYILILTEIILMPIGLAAAIYLIEYAPQGRFVTSVHFAAETLAGIPSIVLGLFGVIAFSVALGTGTSRIAGALTLICLNLPLALRLFEDALASVPRDLREAGLALGGTKWHVIRTAVIPSALPGIVTGIILTAGKVIGEAAALLFTMGLTNPANVFTLNPFIASATLTTHLYNITGPGAGQSGLTPQQENAISAASSALLILILLAINLSARGIGRAIERRIMAA